MQTRTIACLCLLCLLLVGCTSTSDENGSSTLPNTLKVMRTTLFPQNVPPLNKTSNDVAKIQRLYTMAYTLPRIPAQSTCTAFSQGTRYHLRFFQDNKLLQEMVLGDCSVLWLSDTDARRANDSFLSLLSDIIGTPLTGVRPDAGNSSATLVKPQAVSV